MYENDGHQGNWTKWELGLHISKSEPFIALDLPTESLFRTFLLSYVWVATHIYDNRNVCTAAHSLLATSDLSSLFSGVLSVSGTG